MDCSANVVISAATTDVAGHGRVDVRVAGLRILGQQRGRTHDLARLAVTALRHVVLQPSLLNRVIRMRRKTFDGLHLLAHHRSNRRHTGADRLAIHMNGAGAAQRHATAEFGARQVQRIAQHPEQGGVGGRFHLMDRSVDFKRNFHGVIPCKIGWQHWPPYYAATISALPLCHCASPTRRSSGLIVNP